MAQVRFLDQVPVGVFQSTVSPVTTNTGSLIITASSTDDTITYIKGDGSTFTNIINNVEQASSASFATTASTATSASFADTSTSASFATTASFALSSGGGSEPGAVSPGALWSSIQGSATTTFAQKFDITASGDYTMDISASGMHIVDTTAFASTGSRMNIFFHPDSFTTPNQTAGVAFLINSGSGVAISYRCLVSASDSTEYYFSNTAIANITSTITRIAGISRITYSNVAANPSIMTRTGDGTLYLGVGNDPIGLINNQFTGSRGTPIF
jgi:hypothetical protein